MTTATILLSAVTAERVLELWIARRNTARLLSRGAREYSPGHYPAIVLLHAIWLVVLWRWGWRQPLEWGWVGVFLILQILRVWTLASLGRRWTTRIIVLPGAPLLRHGPYRFISHPNYLVVIGEIAVLPLSLGLPWIAAAFSLGNAALLAIRVRAENAALSEIGHVAG